VSRLQLRVGGGEGQVRLADFIDVLNRAKLILADLDSAISENPSGSLDWFITDLRVSSAEAIVESRGKTPAVDDRLGVMVQENFVAGLDTIERGELPPYFGELEMKRVRAIATRLGKPGAEHFTAVHLNGPERSATVTVQAAANVKKLIAPRFKTIGSVVGRLDLISVHTTPRFNVYEALTKRAVVCRFDPSELEAVTSALGQRVAVTGIVNRNLNGDPIRVEQPNIRVLHDEGEVSIRDLIGLVPDLTGGLTPEEYVRMLRNG
jgi:hypothetical protein